MDNTLIYYIERLQLMGFFAGYPLIYALVNVLASEQSKKDLFINRVFRQLPLAYALSGMLFLGYVLNSIYPDFSAENILKQLTFIKIWGLLSILFWIPLFSKKPVISLLHSLVFFFFLIRVLFLHLTSMIGIDMIKNNMSVFTDSILLNTANLAIIVILMSLISKYRK